MKTENKFFIATGLFIIIVLHGFAQGLYTKINACYNLAAGTQTLFNY
jgi:hypothetical protein